MDWSSSNIRTTFLEFFANKGHEVQASAPIVIKDDPTLMFTNAGMNQFKSIFVGNSESEHSRITNSQKCLRVSGKHNDLDEVGRDHYHHTMFEMLGNWSFGDYFKKEAIDWSWELLVGVYKLDPSRLYVSVFSGDDTLGLDIDEEAKGLWANHINEDRILAFGRKENFWEMGDAGPCGPCSEIHYDLRAESDRKAKDGASLVNADHPEVIEIWNLVFMQYDHKKNGELVKLTNQYIDTGMGLERLARVLQDVKSNYEIDVFKSLIERLESVSGKIYRGTDALEDVAFRVIVDHIRAVAFCIADGQLPSSTGAGYVIRRVLRRAVRFAYSQLNISKPILSELVKTLVQQMGDGYPEIANGQKLIERVVNEEEKSFQTTLAKGLERLDDYISSLKISQISGQFAFELYDTYGFPIDLTQMLAEEKELEVDMDGFEAELKQQKERSRSASKADFGDWTVLSTGDNSEFVGYDLLETTSVVRKFRMVKVKGKDLVQLVLDVTPFYPEGGGQLGDRGQLVFGDTTLDVFDTKRENGEILHFVKEYPEALGTSVEAKVSHKWRAEIVKNHTATHLLHLALRDTLGDHVEQKGSMVSPEKLRFDFSHYEKIESETLSEVEASVKRQIASQIKLIEHRSIPINEAKEMGAMALFGEKYGNEVRVIEFGDSIELCGGTHVSNTAEVGGFKLLLETSVASGIRRVEAITGSEYQNFVNSKLSELAEIERLLAPAKDLVDSILKLKETNQKLSKEIVAMQQVADQNLKRELIDQSIEKNGCNIIVRNIGALAGDRLKSMAHQITTDSDKRIAILGSSADDKAFLVISVSKDLLDHLNADANSAIRLASKEINGGGGGQPFLAMAGGSNKEGLNGALEIAKNAIFS